MRMVALVGWVVIVGALLVWQALALANGPAWPTLSDLFRAFERPLAGRLILFAAWLWLGWHLFIRGWQLFPRG
jgi:hypothetical protein